MEFLSNLLSARFALMVVLSTGLVATSASVLVVKHRQLRDEYPMREKQHREEVDTYGSTWEFMWRGLKVEKRPNLLAVFGEGASGRLGRTLEVPGGSYRAASPLHGNPLFRAFETLDPVFVAKVILSLAALLIVYDAVCGEKARGTLKLLLSNPVGRDEVLTGKLLGATASLLVPVLLSFTVGGFVLLFLERSAMTPIVWRALALTLAATLLYVMVSLTVGLAVSSATAYPNSALLWLLFIWVMVIFALPSAGAFAAESFYRVRPQEEVNGQVRAVWNNMRHRWRWVSHKRRHVWNSLPWKERREKAYREYDDIMNDARREISKIHEARRQELGGQMALARMLNWASPASCFETIATRFLGTDYASHERFLDEGRIYGEDLQSFLRKAFRESMKLEELKKKVKGWRSLLPLPPEPLADQLTGVWPEVLVLALLNVVFFMLAHGFFLRYDPT